MNLRSISIGVQAGTEKTRIEIYHRNTADRLLIEKAQLLKKYGILTYFDFIVGNPLEDETAQKDTLKLLMKFPRPFGLNLYKLRYLPRTDLTDMLLEKGVIKPTDVDGIHTRNEKRCYLIFNKLDRNNPDLVYYTNLIYLMGTIFVIKTKRKWYSFAPIPKFIVRFLQKHPQYFLINNMTTLIKLQLMFFSVSGQKISLILSKLGY